MPEKRGNQKTEEIIVKKPPNRKKKLYKIDFKNSRIQHLAGSDKKESLLNRFLLIQEQKNILQYNLKSKDFLGMEPLISIMNLFLIKN